MWGDDAWILDMLQAAGKALAYAEGLGEQDFMTSSIHQDAIIRQLMIIGEASKRVSDEFMNVHPEIPWTKVAG